MVNAVVEPPRGVSGVLAHQARLLDALKQANEQKKYMFELMMKKSKEVEEDELYSCEEGI